MPKIVVEGPDGKRYAFPDTMPREDISAFMKQRYGTKARNETVQDYLARLVREQDATQARARAVDKEATAAGRMEGERAAERMGVSNPFEMAFAAPAIGIAQQEGGRPVYAREGTVLPDEAAGLAALNATGFGVPGLVNQRFGARLAESRRQEPGFALAGDVAGAMIPGEMIAAGLTKAGQVIAPQFAKLGSMFKGKPDPLVLGPQDAVDPSRIVPLEMVDQIRARQATEAARRAAMEDARRVGMEEYAKYATDEQWAAQGFPPRPPKPPTRPAPEPTVPGPYGNDFKDVFEEIDYIVTTGARADGMKGKDFRALISKYPKDKLETYVRRRMGTPNDWIMTEEDVIDSMQQLYQASYKNDIKPMGFDGSRPKVRERAVRNDPFFDERLSPQENKAVEMRRNGYTQYEIADELDITEDHLNVVLSKARTKGVDVGKVVRDDAKQDILALKEKGLTGAQIAARTGKKPEYVKVILSKERRRLKDLGEKIPDWLSPVRTAGVAAGDLAERALGIGVLTAGGAGIKEAEALGAKMKQGQR